MVFKTGSIVRNLVIKAIYSDYNKSKNTDFLPINSTGYVIKRMKINWVHTIYAVKFNTDIVYCYENELELVNDKEETMNIKIKSKGKQSKLYKEMTCARCGEKDYIPAVNQDDCELIDDLEWHSSIERWGELAGEDLCPRCADKLTAIIDDFMNHVVKKKNGSTFEAALEECEKKKGAL